MDNISRQMRILCEDITTAHADRKRSIQCLKEQAGMIRENARRFLSETRLDLEKARQIWNKTGKILKNKKAR